MQDHTHQMPKKIIKFTGLKLSIKIFLILISGIICTFIILSFLEKNHNNAEILAEYQIPFADIGSHLNKVELVEKDEYGRCLYSYESSVYTNVFRDYSGYENGNSSVFVYIIIQKTDNDFIYCYDGHCYTYVKSLKNDNTTVIDKLKLCNDWGSNIDNTKLTAFSKTFFKDSIKKYPIHTIEDIAINKLEKEVKHEINEYFFDVIFLSDGTPVFVLREVIDWGNAKQINYGTTYVFYFKNEQSEITYTELSSDIQLWSEAIRLFIQN